MRRTAVVSSIALCETHELSNQLLLQLLLHGQFINQSNVCSHATRSASSTTAGRGRTRRLVAQRADRV